MSDPENIDLEAIHKEDNTAKRENPKGKKSTLHPLGPTRNLRDTPERQSRRDKESKDRDKEGRDRHNTRRS